METSNEKNTLKQVVLFLNTAFSSFTFTALLLLGNWIFFLHLPLDGIALTGIFLPLLHP